MDIFYTAKMTMVPFLTDEIYYLIHGSACKFQLPTSQIYFWLPFIHPAVQSPLVSFCSRFHVG
jgi:hypothetical protein